MNPIRPRQKITAQFLNKLRNNDGLVVNRTSAVSGNSSGKVSIPSSEQNIKLVYVHGDPFTAEFKDTEIKWTKGECTDAYLLLDEEGQEGDKPYFYRIRQVSGNENEGMETFTVYDPFQNVYKVGDLLVIWTNPLTGRWEVLNLQSPVPTKWLLQPMGNPKYATCTLQVELAIYNTETEEFENTQKEIEFEIEDFGDFLSLVLTAFEGYNYLEFLTTNFARLLEDGSNVISFRNLELVFYSARESLIKVESISAEMSDILGGISPYFLVRWCDG